MGTISTNVPPLEGPIFEEDFRANWQEINWRINTLPVDWTGMAGQILAVRNNEDGPDPASELADGLIVKFFLHPVGNYKLNLISVTANTTLTDTLHSGNVLECTNTGPIQLTANLNANPGLGVGSACVIGIMRGSSAGTVEVVFGGGLTNQNIDGHTKVRAGMMATLVISGSRAYFMGFTE